MKRVGDRNAFDRVAVGDDRQAERERLHGLDLEAGAVGHGHDDGIDGPVKVGRVVEAAREVDARRERIQSFQVLAHPAAEPDAHGRQTPPQDRQGLFDEARRVAEVEAVSCPHHTEDEVVGVAGLAGGQGDRRFEVRHRDHRLVGDPPEEFRLLLLDRPHEIGPREPLRLLGFGGEEVLGGDAHAGQDLLAAAEAVVRVENPEGAGLGEVERPAQEAVVDDEGVVAAPQQQPPQHRLDRRIPPFIDVVVIACRRGLEGAGHRRDVETVPLGRHGVPVRLGHGGVPPFEGIVQEVDPCPPPLQFAADGVDPLPVADVERPRRRGRQHEDVAPDQRRNRSPVRRGRRHRLESHGAASGRSPRSSAAMPSNPDNCSTVTVYRASSWC